MERHAIIELTNRINALSSVGALIDFESQSTISHNHPYPKMLLGYKYSMLGDDNLAYSKFRECIEIEIDSNCKYFDTIFADSIGLSISNICLDSLNEKQLQSVPNDIRDVIFYFWMWGYYYLSNHLVKFNYSGYNSLEIRGKLLERFQEYASSLVHLYFSYASIPNILIISDYYMASILYAKVGDYNKSSHLKSAAQNAHRWLEDISISGQNADEYSIEELSKLGKERHEIILNKLKTKFDFESRFDSFKKLLDYFS